VPAPQADDHHHHHEKEQDRDYLKIFSSFITMVTRGRFVKTFNLKRRKHKT
jgi:hypothetical protein